ncbi:MAG: aldehyde dehydrogenase family protein [Pseudomonadota bacterium]
MDVFKNYINGEWVEGQTETTNVNPSDHSDIVGHYAAGSQSDVLVAVEAAKAAQPLWWNKTPEQRADILDRAGAILLDRASAIGTLLAREEGKALAEAAAEANRAGRIFKYYAAEALRMAGENIASTRPGIDVEITREPLGVIGLITPWNFPIAIPAWKAAPALACGNVVVLKPAGLTPGCAWEMAKALDEAGMPPGVFNLVMGSGGTVGDALLESRDVAAISFTGSVPTGYHIATKCVKSGKKVQMEMGGKNPLVVMDDADLDHTIATCINASFFATGQRCTAASRLIVQDGIYDAFIEKMQTAMKNLRIGHALEDGTQIGPVASVPQLDSNLAYVALARDEGAEVIGGERLNRKTEGNFQAPALFLGAKNDMRVSREEIFGPCASVLRFSDFEEGVAIANDTDFGLSSGICTTSLKHAREYKRRAKAGMVMVNLPTAGVDYHVPFGGTKASSYGSREQGTYAAEFYTHVKTAYVLA